MKKNLSNFKKKFAAKGVLLRNKGKIQTHILTFNGSLKYERTVLVPRDKESAKKLREISRNNLKSIVPLDIVLGVTQLPFKMTIKLMLFIAFIAITESSYEKAQKILYETIKINIGDDTIRKIVNYTGKIVYEDMCNQTEVLLNSINNQTEEIKTINEILYMEADGSFINLLEKGKTGSTWHENKIGMIFNTQDIEKKVNRKGIAYNIIKKREYISFFCKSEEFNKHFFALAIKYNYRMYATIILISDGASWVKSFKSKYIPWAIHILDFYHLADNVWKFARFIYKSDEKRYKETAERWCEMLKNSEYDLVLIELDKYKDLKCPEGVVNLYKYILKNKDLIDYKSYIQNGFLIGSGSVESANKYVLQSRMKLPGMRWNKESAQYTASLRAMICSDKWNYVEELIIKNVYTNVLYNL